MKRLIDVLIVVVLLAVLGVGGYFVYIEYLAEEDPAPGSDTTAQPGDAPAAADVMELPRLSADQRRAVLPTVADLPDAFSEATSGTVRDVDLNADASRVSLATDQTTTARFTEIRSTYNWASAVSVDFNTFTLNQGTSFVRALVSQFPSATQARAFIDDPLVRGYYTALGYTLEPLDDLHGFVLTSNAPVEGTGYATEYQTLLFFDHLGLVVALQANTDANSDPALGAQIVRTLAPRVVENIEALDVLANATLIATPTPQPVTESLLTANIRATSLDGLMPSPRDWSLNALYDVSEDDSAQYALTELIAFYRSFNTAPLTQLADTIDRLGRRYGLIAQSVRVWLPETQCPVDAPVRMELDLSLFERPAGATAYMRDPTLQDAWRGTGVFTEFQDTGDGVFAFGSVNHTCGTMQVVQKSATYERLLYTLSMTVPTTTDRQTVIDQIDAALTATFNDLYMEQLR